MSRKLFIFSLGLAAARLAAFGFIFLNQSHDAQWRLDYFPLWIVDFPISLLYFILMLPTPWAEAIAGPLWWFALPVMMARLVRRRRARRSVSGVDK